MLKNTINIFSVWRDGPTRLYRVMDVSVENIQLMSNYGRLELTRGAWSRMKAKRIYGNTFNRLFPYRVITPDIRENEILKMCEEGCNDYFIDYLYFDDFYKNGRFGIWREYRFAINVKNEDNALMLKMRF